MTPRREGTPMGFREVEMAYLRSHRGELAAKYAGSWITLEGERIVAVGSDEFEADSAARKAGVEAPFVVYIPTAEEAQVPFIGVL